MHLQTLDLQQKLGSESLSTFLHAEVSNSAEKQRIVDLFRLCAVSDLDVVMMMPSAAQIERDVD